MLIRRYINGVILLIWLCFSITCGTLGWVITGGTSQRILITVLTSFSFGIIGCLIDILKRLIYNDEKLENVRVFFRPLFSGLIAFMILGIAELVPVIFQTNTAAVG